MTTPKEPIQPTNTPEANPPTVWSYKPWWCQPWSILLTGSSLILGSWGLFNRLWVTVIVAMPMLAWMGFFILVYPQLIRGEAKGEDET
jgi:hypothetical protein